jgi:hypothetical protein
LDFWSQRRGECFNVTSRPIIATVIAAKRRIFFFVAGIAVER